MNHTVKSAVLTAQHGWGYDWRTFKSWQKLLPATWHLKIRNRGYFKDVADRNFGIQNAQSEFSTNIVVCHSFGLHLLDAATIKGADHLVIISSFGQFHIENNSYSKKAIRRMLMRLTSEPATVLNEFYGACMNTAANLSPAMLDDIVEQVDLDLLAGDLQELNKVEFEFDKITDQQSVLILHGANDSIVSPLAAEILHKRIPQSSLIVHDDGGHALPLSHSQWCVEQILAHVSCAQVPV